MSVSVIQRHSGGTLDRVSIYRTLQKFLKCKLVRCVPNISGEMKYILAEAVQDIGAQHTPVTYFICTCCGNTATLAKPRIENLVLPEQASVMNFHLIIEGLCVHCQELQWLLQEK
jgi:Fur family transcriptional regulator, ferric uptake regulator